MYIGHFSSIRKQNVKNILQTNRRPRNQRGVSILPPTPAGVSQFSQSSCKKNPTLYPILLYKKFGAFVREIFVFFFYKTFLKIAKPRSERKCEYAPLERRCLLFYYLYFLDL
uniref:Uncharacterized protein n=1 Tax=Cacopsylla melanoneura TaxID=428564 RepID=A0A8D8XUK1_9HEMI